MAILTKEGKVYVLEGPNPLVEKQAPWDTSKLVFHNFHWSEIKHASPRAKQNAPKQEAPPPPTPAVKTPEPAPPQPEPTPTAAVAQDQPADETKDFDLPFIKYKVLCHCLPAKTEARSDPFYGESWSRVSYGTKFVFPCIVMSSDDLLFEFWTSDPKEQIKEKSIVYPFSYEVHNPDTNSYDKVPYDDYRWWRVSKRESREGGWLFSASPSDHQPDFSD
jgi:hypothetical protein